MSPAGRRGRRFILILVEGYGRDRPARALALPPPPRQGAGLVAGRGGVTWVAALASPLPLFEWDGGSKLPPLRQRFWIELALALASAALLVVTLLWNEWIELVFHVDPDAGSGA